MFLLAFLFSQLLSEASQNQPQPPSGGERACCARGLQATWACPKLGNSTCPRASPRVGAGKLLAVQQLPWSLVWCGASGAIAGCGGQGCVPGQGGGRLLWGDRGCPRDGQVVLVPESQPREGTELAHSWAAAPCGFPLSHGCSLPFSSLGRSLQRDYNEGPSCNEFDCCFSTINSFNFFHFKVP